MIKKQKLGVQRFDFEKKMGKEFLNEYVDKNDQMTTL
jgi:hypothetical protein